MIVVSTNRSATEKALHRYASRFFAGLPRNGSSLHLKSPRSVSKNFILELRSRTGVPVFFFGHGLNPPAIGFLGDDGKPALDAKNMALLTRRKVAATCCHGDRVGSVARRNRFSVFGYKGLYWVPKSSRHVTDCEAAALAGPSIIAQGGSPAQAALAAEREYRRLAQLLYSRNRVGDRAFASFVAINATTAGAW